MVPISLVFAVVYYIDIDDHLHNMHSRGGVGGRVRRSIDLNTRIHACLSNVNSNQIIPTNSANSAEL